MSNEEFVRLFGSLWHEATERYSNDDFIINLPQMHKLAAVYKFFSAYVLKHGGKIKPLNLEPRELHGWFEAEFVIFDPIGDEIMEFGKLLSYASAFGIDPTEDGVIVYFTIPHVFVHKDEEWFDVSNETDVEYERLFHILIDFVENDYEETLRSSHARDVLMGVCECTEEEIEKLGLDFVFGEEDEEYED